jgi:hypothetical protein
MIEDNNIVNEPTAGYGLTSSEKKIIFFNSFDEAEEYGLRQMANHSHAQRLANLETIRKRTYSYLLLPDGSWPPIARIIVIEKASYL